MLRQRSRRKEKRVADDFETNPSSTVTLYKLTEWMRVPWVLQQMGTHITFPQVAVNWRVPNVETEDSLKTR